MRERVFTSSPQTTLLLVRQRLVRLAILSDYGFKNARRIRHNTPPFFLENPFYRGFLFKRSNPLAGATCERTQ